MAAEWTTPDAVHSKCGETSPRFAALAIDDDTGTFWRHISSCYHWIIFDMGETKTITKIRVYQVAADYEAWGEANGIYVYVSDNPEDFGAPVWEGALYAAGWRESGEFEKAGRYIKLVSKSNTAYQTMHEFDAYAEVVAGVAHEKTVSEIVGFVDSHSKVQHHKKTVSESVGFVDEHDKDRCKKCPPSSVVLVF